MQLMLISLRYAPPAGLIGASLAVNCWAINSSDNPPKQTQRATNVDALSPAVSCCSVRSVPEMPHKPKTAEKTPAGHDQSALAPAALTTSAHLTISERMKA